MVLFYFFIKKKNNILDILYMRELFYFYWNWLFQILFCYDQMDLQL